MPNQNKGKDAANKPKQTKPSSSAKSSIKSDEQLRHKVTALEKENKVLRAELDPKVFREVYDPEGSFFYDQFKGLQERLKQHESGTGGSGTDVRVEELEKEKKKLEADLHIKNNQHSQFEQEIKRLRTEIANVTKERDECKTGISTDMAEEKKKNQLTNQLSSQQQQEKTEQALKQLNENIEQLNTELATVKKERDDYQTKLTNATSSTNAANDPSEQTDAPNDVSKVQELEKIVLELKKEKTDIQHEADKVSGEKTELKDTNDKLKEENDKLKASNDALKETTDKLTTDLTKVTGERDAAKKSINEKEADINKLELKITQLERDYGESQGKVKELKAKSKESEKKFQAMAESKTESTNMENVWKEQLDEYEKEVNTLKGQLDSANKEKNKLIDDVEKEKLDLKRKIQEKQSEVDTLKAEIDPVKKEKERLKKDLDDHKNKCHDAFEKIREKDKLLEMKDKEHKEIVKTKEARLDEARKKITDLQTRGSGNESTDLREAKKEIESLKTRLSQVMGAKLSDNNPSIADLSDGNRPTKLGERYSELYDNEWTDAFETLEKGNKSEVEVIKALLNTLTDIYDFCGKKSEVYLDNIHQGALCLNLTAKRDKSKDDQIDVTRRKMIKEIKKSFAPLISRDVLESYKEKQKSGHMNDKNYARFVKECVEICWLMSVQDPPVVLDVSEPKDFNSDRYKAYTKNGKVIDYIVWPPLLLCKDGNMLTKGVAQAK